MLEALADPKFALTLASIQKKVVPMCERHFPDASSKNAWVLQFYHPHVQKNVQSKEAFEQLAADAASFGDLKVGAVDCQQNGEFCSKHGIQEAPTTRFLLRGQKQEFDGSEHTLEALKAFVKNSRGRIEDMEEALKCTVKGVFTDPGKDSTIPLCADRFPPSLDPLPWLISFYESGDRNKDKTMRSAMNKLGDKFGNCPPKKASCKKGPAKVRVGAVSCEGNCGELGISTFPTVRFYKNGAEPVDFDSFFDREELQVWTEARIKEMKQQEKVKVLEADMPQESAQEL